jgi:hypothetical protein
MESIHCINATVDRMTARAEPLAFGGYRQPGWSVAISGREVAETKVPVRIVV